MTLLDKDGEPVGERSAAEMRAELAREARLYEARLLRGDQVELTVEAEAGAILAAEQAVEIHGLHEMARAWMEANRG